MTALSPRLERVQAVSVASAACATTVARRTALLLRRRRSQSLHLARVAPTVPAVLTTTHAMLQVAHLHGQPRRFLRLRRWRTLRSTRRCPCTPQRRRRLQSEPPRVMGHPARRICRGPALTAMGTSPPTRTGAIRRGQRRRQGLRRRRGRSDTAPTRASATSWSAACKKQHCSNRNGTGSTRATRWRALGASWIAARAVRSALPADTRAAAHRRRQVQARGARRLGRPRCCRATRAMCRAHGCAAPCFHRAARSLCS
mmetsp:Transcript_7387/g.26389  ORF Transcript_7387/g.26389 Transcript_7387/m.26389 type:complete len:257 (+) Transcript_7387:696-1466(+)